MDKLNRLYLVRHGQVEGHEDFRANGHTDVDITEVGRLQMQDLAERLRHVIIDAIYSSDLKRSKIGAQIIAKHHDAPHMIIPELREVCFGDWEGMSLSEIRENYPDELERRQADPVDYKYPGDGESMRELSDRTIPRFQKILNEQKGNDILIVAHGGVNRVILSNVLGLDPPNMFKIHQDYGCLNIIDFYHDFTSVRLING